MRKERPPRPQYWGSLISLLLLTLVPMRGAAQGNPTRPDVLILVYALSSGQGQVGITYPGVVPHAQAQRDLKALQSETGWHVSDVSISDESPPIQKKLGKMTGMAFTASGALVAGSGTLPVEPIISALRGYKQIGLTYFTEPGFGFQGLRTYRDDHVQIAMTQSGSTYSYRIVVRDPHFGKLNLPRFQAGPGAARVAGAGNAGRAVSRPLMVALAVLAAIGAGGLVYVALARQA